MPATLITPLIAQANATDRGSSASCVNPAGNGIPIRSANGRINPTTARLRIKESAARRSWRIAGQLLFELNFVYVHQLASGETDFTIFPMDSNNRYWIDSLNYICQHFNVCVI